MKLLMISTHLDKVKTVHTSNTNYFVTKARLETPSTCRQKKPNANVAFGIVQTQENLVGKLNVKQCLVSVQVNAKTTPKVL